MNNITFVLFTYNEEKRIAYAIQNFVQYGDVIIMDAGSTDRTKEIAEKLGARFFLRPDNQSPQVETQRNFASIKDNIHTNWIYWGYVDNIAPKSLVEKFVEISQQDTYTYVLVPLYTYLWGNVKRLSQKSYSPFFFHKDAVDFADNYIHGMGKFLGSKEQILRLPNKSKFALRHFSTYTMHKFVLGHLRYAEQEAKEKFERGERFSFFRMCAGMLRYMWIYRRSVKNGVYGIMIVMAYPFFRLMAYASLYEHEHDITIDTIEEKYAVLKGKMLQEFKKDE